MKTLEDQQQDIEEIGELTGEIAEKLSEINEFSRKKTDTSFELVMKEVILEFIRDLRKELPFSLTPKDLTELLPVSSTKVYKLLERGKIPAKKVDGKWAIQRELFLAWYCVYEIKNIDDFSKVI